EGDFGVLSGHAPFMTTLKIGDVVVIDGSTRRVFEIQGGFADVTPQGLTILAEQAVEYGPKVQAEASTSGPFKRPTAGDRGGGFCFTLQIRHPGRSAIARRAGTPQLPHVQLRTAAAARSRLLGPG